MRTALVLGSTGLVGGQLLRQLLADDLCERVITLVRRPTGLVHPKLREQVVDFDHLHLARESFAVDDLYCCLGTTIKKAGSQAAFRRVDYDYPVAAARLAVESGVQHYLLVSSMGADPHSRIFYSRVKGEVEAAVAGAGLPSVGVVRPSLLLGEREEFRFGEAVAAAVSKVVAPLMPGKIRPITGQTVARAMIRIAREGPPGVQIYLNDELHRIGQPSPPPG